MIVKGRPRGNAPQLADYLLSMGENEKVTLMDVDGQQTADPQAFKDLLYSMELNSELTKSGKSVYHALLNPSIDDRVMTMEEWHLSVDILARELKMENQRRAVVLHTKPNKPAHAHVVFERYDHEQEKMISDSHNYLAHDKAREKLEKELSHKRTPQKNLNREKHKQVLTEIWNGSSDGKEFINKAFQSGYQIAKGTERRPFKFIDSEGISFDLPKHLQGTRTKEVAQRLANEELPTEKECIQKAQISKQKLISKNAVIGFKTVEAENADQKRLEAEDRQAENERQEIKRIEFIRTMKEMQERNRTIDQLKKFTISAIIVLRVAFSFKGSEALKNMSKLDQFKLAKTTILHSPTSAHDRRLGFIEASQFYKPT